MKERHAELLKQILSERYPGFEVEIKPTKDSDRLFTVQMYSAPIPPTLVGDGAFLWAFDGHKPGIAFQALFKLIDELIAGEKCCEKCKRPL